MVKKRKRPNMEDLKETVTRVIEFQLDQQKRVEEMFLLQQQKADERMQKTESLLQALISRDQTQESNVAFPQSAVLNTINNFIYCPKSNQTFVTYFRRYEDLYNIDCSNWSDQKKVHLLLSKLGAANHDKFVNYILPQKTSDLTFTETVKLLTELFSPKTSLFHKRWKCLNPTKKKTTRITWRFHRLSISIVTNSSGHIWVPMILSASFLSRDFSQQKTPKSDEEF